MLSGQTRAEQNQARTEHGREQDTRQTQRSADADNPDRGQTICPVHSLILC